jgi:drug/metabolite transporter (DMT)-like permease
MTQLKDAKVYKSPRALIKSPRFHDLIFTKSPSLKINEIYEDDETVTEDQIYNEVMDIIVTEETNVWITGLVLLFASVIFWILSVQILNNVMKKTDFDHPLLAAYFNGSFFILFGLKSLIADFKKLFLKIFKVNSANDNALNLQSDNDNNNGNNNSNYNSTNQTVDSSSDEHISVLLETPKVQLSHSQIVKVAMFSTLLYVLNCYLGSAALKYTSASNQTILATSSSVFSLIIGVICKIEKFTFSKVISVSCSIFGIILITFSTTAISTETLKLSTENFGNLLALIGAFSYSCFLTLLRIKLGEQTDSENDSLLYGYIGFTTLIGTVPVLMVYDFFGWEKLTLPTNKKILIMLLSSSLLNAFSDYFGSCASLITSPLSVSLSLSTAIPISMFLDSYFNGGVTFSIQYFFGIFLIFASFIFINIKSEQEIVEFAIENAIEEAINYDESLTELLSPRLQPKNNDLLLYPSSADIPGLSISSAFEDHPLQPRLIVTGGQNHKYFFREIKESII